MGSRRARTPFADAPKPSRSGRTRSGGAKKWSRSGRTHFGEAQNRARSARTHFQEAQKLARSGREHLGGAKKPSRSGRLRFGEAKNCGRSGRPPIFIPQNRRRLRRGFGGGHAAAIARGDPSRNDILLPHRAKDRIDVVSQHAIAILPALRKPVYGWKYCPPVPKCFTRRGRAKAAGSAER